MKKLLIVESPAKIKTIKKISRSEFKIMSTMGHVKKIYHQKKWVLLVIPITLTYIPIKDKAKTIAELCKAAQGVDEVYLAPDPDREGEIITWHVAEEIKKLLKIQKPFIVLLLSQNYQRCHSAGIANQHTIDLEK